MIRHDLESVVSQPQETPAANQSPTTSSSRQTTSNTTQLPVLICGIDFAVPSNAAPKRIKQLLAQIADDLPASGELESLWITPVSYGSHCDDSQVPDQPLQCHRIPSPHLPIPETVDFLGRHASHIESEVRLAIPDANRTYQMRQKIKSVLRRERSAILMAATPGVIGYHIRRSGIKARKRNRSVPLVAVHCSRWQQFATARIRSILETCRSGSDWSSLLPLQDWDLAQTLFPALQNLPEVRRHWRNIAEELASIQHHWHVHAESTTFFDRTWGQLLLALANKTSQHAHHRLQGSLAAGRGLEQLLALWKHAVGFPLPQNGDARLWSEFVPGLATEVASQLILQYLNWFYEPFDLIVNLEGESGRSKLRDTGVPSAKILDWSNQPFLPRQIQEAIANQSPTVSRGRTVKQRTRISEFQWQQGDSVHPTHLAISDIHLGDGNAAERSLAIYALAKQTCRLQVSQIELVGDLIQRDVPPDVVKSHRTSFLNALKSLTSVVTDRSASPISLSMKWSNPGEADGRHQDLEKELHRFAVQQGLALDLDGTALGIPEQDHPSAIPIHIEAGNHDEGEELANVIPGASISESMIRFDETTGALFCHGHIWNLPEVSQALQSAWSFEDLSNQLQEPALRDSLESAQIIYSITSAIWRACAKRIDVRGIWKRDLQPLLSQFVQWQRSRHPEGGLPETGFSHFLNGVISPVDNAEVAARCGLVTRRFRSNCWVVCDGHSHRPGIEWVTAEHPSDGRTQSILLVNCGKFHGKNMTVVLLRFPEVAIFQWDARDQEYYLLDYRQLTQQELRQLDGFATDNRRRESHSGRLRNQQKILLEVCSQGTGHQSRQEGLREVYAEFADLEWASTGERKIPGATYTWPGYSLLQDDAGSIRPLATFSGYFSQRSQIQATARRLVPELKRYLALITDFGPVLPTAIKLARRQGVRDLPALFHLSHHAALHSTNVEVPRPDRLDPVTYWATQRYIDSIAGDFNLGFHFEPYHSNILTPPIHDEIRRATSTFESSEILVYLSGNPWHTAQQCSQLDPEGRFQWIIYSRQIQQVRESEYQHIRLHPVDGSYRQQLPKARAVVLNAGFMGPAELLHLGKPMVCIPIPGHGEQAFNAAALGKISDVTIVSGLKDPVDQRLIQTTLELAAGLNCPMQRSGLLGPILPYPDVGPRVSEFLDQGITNQKVRNLLNQATGETSACPAR